MPQQLGNLAVGAKVKDTTTTYYEQPIVWKVAGKNHSGYPANSVTLITERIIGLKSSDAKEASNTDANRQSYGNNRHIYSNLRKWLNSNANAGAWYAAQHAADAPPSAANVWSSNNPYDTEAGFLKTFSSNLINAMLTTTLTVARNTVTDGGASETYTDKIFLASNTEVGLANENSVAEGVKLALFSDNASRLANPTAQAVTNSTYKDATNLVDTKPWYWWLRTPYASNSNNVRSVNSDGSLSDDGAFYGNNGVRPLCNLQSTILVSDTVDADGAYTVIWNRPPSAPTEITVPEIIYSNQTTQIGWSAVTDPDGDSVSYKLERSVNGGSWTQVYSGANTTFTDTITTAMNTLQYRVKAVDSFNNESSYTTSATRAVIHNLPPAISGVDGNLGVKTDAFNYQYTVTDPESNGVTIQEKINGVLTKTYNATLGTAVNMEVKGVNWVKLAQGSHTLSITATDTYGGSVTRTMTFTKQVDRLLVELTTPLEATAMPTRINIDAVAQVPAGAEFSVMVCNNANDPSPAWEDATEAVLAHLAHVFTNKMKQATNWGVNIRVSVIRSEALGDCYITGIGGNFE